MESELIIKKSKFYGYSFDVTNEEEIKILLEKLKKENKKATHICYAYSINYNGCYKEKFCDDNEPNGTAGRPILEVIKKKNLNNIVVFVVRYFGGIKLGAGGLIRAYAKTASSVLESK